MNRYKNLNVWRRSVEFATKVYEVTANFPPEEKYGLTSQMRRCAVSIPSNIAEGASRSSKKDFKLFLEYAYGSANELETQLHISSNLKYVNPESYESLTNEIEEIQKMIYSFSKTLKE